MSYEVGPGIPTSDLPAWQDELRTAYGLRPDGCIDFNDASFVPVVLCAVQLESKLLLVQRNPARKNAGGKWSFISGYLDKPMSIAHHAQQEMWHEAEIVVPRREITVRNSYTLTKSEQPRDHMVWLCHVLLYEEPELKFNSEEIVDAAWVEPENLQNYNILDDLVYAKAVALGEVTPGDPIMA